MSSRGSDRAPTRRERIRPPIPNTTWVGREYPKGWARSCGTRREAPGFPGSLESGLQINRAISDGYFVCFFAPRKWMRLRLRRLHLNPHEAPIGTRALDTDLCARHWRVTVRRSPSPASSAFHLELWKGHHSASSTPPPFVCNGSTLEPEACKGVASRQRKRGLR